MPTSLDLMGLSMPSSLAGGLGNDPTALTATGTTQATAALIKSHLVSVTAASSQTGVILPAAAKIGTPYYITSLTSTNALVYAPVGHTLNGLASTTAVTISAQFHTGIFIQVSSKVWSAIPFAP